MLPGNHAQHEVPDVVIPGMLRRQGKPFYRRSTSAGLAQNQYRVSQGFSRFLLGHIQIPLPPPHSACHRFDVGLTLFYHHIDISSIACICHAMALIRRTRQSHTHADGHVARSVRRDATRWMPGSLSYQLASSGNTTEELRYRAFQYWRAPHSSTVTEGREVSVNRPIGRRSPARGAGVCGNHAFMRIISQGERWNSVILEYWSRVRFGENSARLAY